MPDAPPFAQSPDQSPDLRFEADHNAVAPGAKPLTVLQVVPSLNQGGVERGALEIAEAIAAAGGQSLIVSAGGRMEPWFRQAGAQTLRLPLDRKNPLALWRNTAALTRLIEKHKPDIVHARSRAPAWSALWAVRRARRRGTQTTFVTTWHGRYSENAPFKRRYNSVMARGDAVIAVSEYIAERIRAAYPWAISAMTTIYRGADLKAFSETAVSNDRAARLAATWRIEEDVRPIFLMPTRFSRFKGLETVIDAAALLRDAVGPEFLILVAGDPRGAEDYARDLQKQVAQAGLENCVYFVGHCADMATAYRLSSCVLSASSQPEALGRVAIEAQAMGRPAIATNHGGSRETIDHGVTGWLIPPDDPAALAAAMRAVLGMDEAAAAAMGAAGRKRVEQLFSLQKMRADTLSTYERVTGRRFEDSLEV